MPSLVKQHSVAYNLRLHFTYELIYTRVRALFCRLFDVEPRHRRRKNVNVLLGVGAFVPLNISC